MPYSPGNQLNRYNMTQNVFFARLREDFQPGFLPFGLYAQEEVPINAVESLLKPDSEFVLMKRDCIGIYEFSVPRDICTVFKKSVMSRFVTGDIVKKRGSTCVFRIYGVKWERVDYWYQDAWGESRGTQSGAFESDLELASEFEIEAYRPYIEYYDNLMSQRAQFYQQSIINHEKIT